jgi:protocatechuate 3,4-dioxygenase beta subunit
MAIPSDEHSHHAGLAADLRVLSRRRLFGMVAKAAAGLSLFPVLLSCDAENGDTIDASDGADGASGTGAGTCSKIPQETSGPYPGDGTNGPNVLTQSGIVRSDIRTSFASLSGTAEGVVLTVTLTIVSSATCEPVAGRAVYVWHCDRDGNYSLYSPAVVNQNYLRGVQVTDSAGQVTFTTIFPACYSGRWPHIHFEVYSSAASATSGSAAIATSQLALPKAVCDAVYATSGYSASVTNLSRVTLGSDMVFADGATLEIPTVTGSVAAGYAAALTIAV